MSQIGQNRSKMTRIFESRKLKSKTIRCNNVIARVFETKRELSLHLAHVQMPNNCSGTWLFPERLVWSEKALFLLQICKIWGGGGGGIMHNECLHLLQKHKESNELENEAVGI